MKKVLAICVLLLAAGAAVWISLGLPNTPREPEVFLTFERGSSTRAIAEKLAGTGVIRHPWQFLAMRTLNPRARLQAGEYRFSGAASVREVFGRIARGDVYYFPFTVPEGSNMFDIGRLLEQSHILPAADFLRAASDATLIRDLAPGAKSLEGYLFPSTYQLSHATTAAQLCQMMVREFRRQWARNGGGAAAVHETVTLASLVEKETGVSEERPLVASVFANRLKKPMRLDCDPTVIYAALLENHYTGVIRRSDLNRRHPYNTYQNDGLPPGPIANPGVESIAAALHPAETDYLFFVAKPEGGAHVFSSTLAAHQKAVASYRHGSQSNNKSAKPTAPKAPGKAG